MSLPDIMSLPENTHRLRFAPFELDVATGELRRGTEIKRLAPQPCKVLAYLARHAGEVVSRRELQTAVWGDDVHVDFERGLNFCIRQIRRTLGDEARKPRYIETLPRRGYRFLVPVSSLATSPTEPASSDLLPPATAAPPTGRFRWQRHGAPAAAVFLAVLITATVASLAGISDAFTSETDPAKIRASAAAVDPFVPAHPEPAVAQAATEAYLEGRYLAAQKTPDDLERAAVAFERAIQLAPDFAGAHASLAEALIEMTYLGIRQPQDGYRAAQDAARRALALDDRFAEAHLALAAAAFFHDFDWRLAERELARTLALAPNLARAHHWQANYLAAMGRHDEAITAALHARQLEPESALITLDLGWFYYLAKDHDAAIAACRQALVLEPDFAPAYTCLTSAYAAQNRPRPAIAAARDALGAQGVDGELLARFESAVASDGLPGLWRFKLQLLGKDTATRKACAAFPAAVHHAALGDTDEALAWLEIARRERSGWLPFVAVEPMLAVLHGDRRFRAFVADLGLPIG